MAEEEKKEVVGHINLVVKNAVRHHGATLPPACRASEHCTATREHEVHRKVNFSAPLPIYQCSKTVKVQGFRV